MKHEIKSQTASVAIESFGAELRSYQDASGTEYMWKGDPKYWSGVSPVLFPIVGALKDEKTLIEGKTYSMKQHGFLRKMEFDCVSCQGNKAVFSASSTEETLKQYPYRFTLTITYALNESVLNIRYELHNTDDRTLTYMLGAHPAFNIPLAGQGTFDEYVIEFAQEETLACPYLNPVTNVLEVEKRRTVLDGGKRIPVSHTLFDDGALVFDALKSRSVKLYHINSGRGVEMHFADFDFLGIWSPTHTDAPFICLEPWLGMHDRTDESGVYEKKIGARTLSAGSSVSFQFDILPL